MTFDDDKTTVELAKNILKDCGRPYTAGQLTDVFSIMNVKNMYFWCVDHMEWDLIRDIFVKEGFRSFWNGQLGTSDPEEQIVQNRHICDNTMVPMHMGHNMIVQFLDSTHARLLTRLNDYHTYRDDDSTYEGFGYYVDDFIEEDGRWKIQTLRLTYRVTLGSLRNNKKQ